MCRFLRRCTGRCLRAAGTRLQDSDGSTWPPVRWLGHLARLSFLAALCLGPYARWWATSEPTLLVALALSVVVVVVVLCACVRVVGGGGLVLVHLWLGFLLGLQAFLGGPDPEAKARAANYLLLTSVATRTLWALLGRAGHHLHLHLHHHHHHHHLHHHHHHLLTSAELLELLGFAASSTSLPAAASASVSVLLAALAAVMVLLRAKASWALSATVVFVVVAPLCVFEAMHVPVNPFALGCLFGRLVCDPLLDAVSTGPSVTQRWRPLLSWSASRCRLSLVAVAAVEVTFLGLAAVRLADPGRWWYLLVPGFVACAPFWAAGHLVLLTTLWGFHSKLRDCWRQCSSQGSGVGGLNKVMASKGLRHFCLISERLVGLSLWSTVAVAALCWQASSSIFLSVFLLVLPLECLFHGLFHELGNSLGGTCVGYALVIPTNFCSLDGQPMLLPPSQVQELNKRSTGMLNNIQRFFGHHVIETFGCDYSTSGMTQEALQAKLTAFFDLQTADGPRHDTYVIFYSGHSQLSGEWALAGGNTLRLDQILSWWRQRNGSFCSRLIFVLDCDNSLPWVNEVKQVEGLYVAVQGATLARVTDVEQQDFPQLGDFTSQWVEYNCNPNSNIQWSERGRAVLATYGVSKYWSDYTLHLPTGSDVTNYWSTFFPRMSNPVRWMVAGGWVAGGWLTSGLSGLGLGGRVLRYLKRLKMNWYPPATLDTGQGFKLVRSYQI